MKTLKYENVVVIVLTLLAIIIPNPGEPNIQTNFRADPAPMVHGWAPYIFILRR